MWTREQIKGNAKYVLGFSYWKALLACLIISFVAGVSNMSGSSTSYMITYQLSGSRFSWRIGGVLLAVFFHADCNRPAIRDFCGQPDCSRKMPFFYRQPAESRRL